MTHRYWQNTTPFRWAEQWYLCTPISGIQNMKERDRNLDPRRWNKENRQKKKQSNFGG
jgi:hypothetical protein